MLRKLNRTTLWALTILLWSASGTTYAETAYISDELTVPLRSGPSGGHRILHRGLPSGTTLEIVSIDEEAGFTQIRTTRGTEGWIRSQYLVREPIAKMRLREAQRRVSQLEARLADSRSEITALNESNAAQANSNQQANAQVSALQNELAELQAISADAVTNYEENLRLQEVNRRLQDELDDIAEERDMLADNAANEGIMLGAGFILLGLIAGVLIKARPQRSAWN